MENFEPGLISDKNNIKEETRRQTDEFMSGAENPFNLKDLPLISRKKFLALISASAAFALTGCSNYRDRGEIVPYKKKPEGITPGISSYYASTCDGCKQLCGILVKTREGRPVKIDGNPDHPVNLGKICAKGQASILNLYDPYRLREPQYLDNEGVKKNLSWENADSEIFRYLNKCSKENREIAIITKSCYSPSSQKVISDFIKTFPTARVYSYEFFNESTRQEAWELCYGRKNQVIPSWENAKIVVLLEADILGTEGSTIEQIRKITEKRDTKNLNEFNRIYSVEGSLSITGAQADYRLRLRPDRQTEFAALLLSEILQHKGNIPGEVRKLVPSISLSEFCNKNNLNKVVVNKLINDIIDNREECIVYAGTPLPLSAHILVNYINHILQTKVISDSTYQKVGGLELSRAADFDQLVERMKKNMVGAVIHFDANPVYHLPSIFEYQNALKNVQLRVSLTESEDETSSLCNYILPIHNALESWGDFQERLGIYSLRQPIVEPLYNSRQKESILLTWIYGPDRYKDTIFQEYLINRWKDEIYPVSRAGLDFKSFWLSALHDGVIQIGESNKVKLDFNIDALKTVRFDNQNSNISILLKENHFIGDGKFSNNGWLQEIPHPISKVVWDNYAALSDRTAKEYGIKNGDIIEVKNKYGSIKIRTLIQPGHADGCISIEIGYGRWNAGPIGSDVGTNINPLLPKEWLYTSSFINGATINRTEVKEEIISTQEHHSLDEQFVKDFHLKRKIIQEGTVADYQNNNDFLHKEKQHAPNITSKIIYSGVKWAMAIDLNKCTGCSACVASCNVENNIPVVGKDQVAKGREMQWIRIDRYYSGTDDDLKVSFQPILCQHCDNAPCENVCPVVATNHSPDGLNQMVYNRCVGTKYCSNNCPYKVRRFNFFDWRDYLADGYYEQDPISLLYNPEVTVRSRGVMEKCTFCVQRIKEAQNQAKNEQRAIRDGEVVPACVQTCPTDALIFGNLMDPASAVRRKIADPRAYQVLGYLNTKPAVIYLKKVVQVI